MLHVLWQESGDWEVSSKPETEALGTTDPGGGAMSKPLVRLLWTKFLSKITNEAMQISRQNINSGNRIDAQIVISNNIYIELTKYSNMFHLPLWSRTGGRYIPWMWTGPRMRSMSMPPFSILIIITIPTRQTKSVCISRLEEFVTTWITLISFN